MKKMRVSTTDELKRMYGALIEHEGFRVEEGWWMRIYEKDPVIFYRFKGDWLLYPSVKHNPDE